GPTPEQIRAFGLKHTARELAQSAGLPLLPGSGLLRGVEHALTEAERIGYPVMLKSSAGGGGIGMQLARDPSELANAFAGVQRLSKNNFGDASVYLERFIERARHLEVQLFGDGRGRVAALGERDCSAQRRNQKVIEETPAPELAPALRQALLEAAALLGKSVAYRSAGTVEFVYDADREEFYFLEVNTRLQVEHGVTEAVLGVDLVEWMVRTAAGHPPDLEQLPVPRGHAIEARVYAEDPAREFRPCAGSITALKFPDEVRVDSWVEPGSEVSAHYDPMLAKIIVHGTDRADAVARLARALDETQIAGIETNVRYLRALAREPALTSGQLLTQTLGRLAFSTPSVEVLAPGTFSILVDHPGRLGYWNIGVPPSGPMDALAHQLAQRCVGNPERSVGLELTVAGPTLRFTSDTLIALAGAHMPATLDGERIEYHRPVPVRAGQTLRLGVAEGGGARTYLALRGGFDVPEYLGSRTTFTLGGFGGHAGRTLRRGDVLHVASPSELRDPSIRARALEPCSVAPERVPSYGSRWEIGVMYGPHGAPDFFTPGDIEMLLSTDWEVHPQSSRTGVRLVGPKPTWARRDGGEAGLHPSNIHDVAYAVGAIDFTGDMPIILGPDGPSLGGFVCPATIIAADLWKIGQLRPGDKVRFQPVTATEAREREAAQEAEIETLTPA
ncbi:MAG TPA: 5-oxoprolinase/urea amidolyase family protein, partial [Polyangiaceae bacterium]|nr:5-oxoprolinase/urea amidolyase family protein [Polyangiaceae bacterium]